MSDFENKPYSGLRNFVDTDSDSDDDDNQDGNDPSQEIQKIAQNIYNKNYQSDDSNSEDEDNSEENQNTMDESEKQKIRDMIKNDIENSNDSDCDEENQEIEEILMYKYFCKKIGHQRLTRHQTKNIARIVLKRENSIRTPIEKLIVKYKK